MEKKKKRKPLVIKEILEDAIKCYLKYEDNILSESISLTAITKDSSVTRKYLAKIRDTGYKKIRGKYYFRNEALQKFMLVYKEYKLNANATINGICAKHDLDPKFLSNNYQKLMGESLPPRYKVQFNREVFNQIDNPNKAYWLGFLTADGSIFRHELRLKIGNVDYDHMVKYINFMGGDESMLKIEIHQTTGNKLVKAIFCDEHMVDKLKCYGFNYHKSAEEIPYYDIDDSLVFHYIRGILDGDGYIKKDNSLIGWVGSKELLNWIKVKCEDKIGRSVTGNVLKRNDTDSGLHYFNLYGKDKIEISKVLFESAETYLNRKYELAKKLKLL
jgi:hypothetical protein